MSRMNESSNRQDVAAAGAQVAPAAHAVGVEQAAGAPAPQPEDPAQAARRAARIAQGAATPQDLAALRARDESYMRLALQEAECAARLGEVPIGAVVVHEPVDAATRRPLAAPEVVGRACNLRETTQDPAGHAEFLALKQASERLGVWRLSGCTVYVTLEPCLMCAGLMQQARVERCVYGAADPKAGALGSLYQINADARLNHTFEVQPGVLSDECAAILREFFASRRKK